MEIFLTIHLQLHTVRARKQGGRLLDSNYEHETQQLCSVNVDPFH